MTEGRVAGPPVFFLFFHWKSYESWNFINLVRFTPILHFISPAAVFITSYEVQKVIIGDIHVDLKWWVGPAIAWLKRVVMAELSEG